MITRALVRECDCGQVMKVIFEDGGEVVRMPGCYVYKTACMWPRYTYGTKLAALSGRIPFSNWWEEVSSPLKNFIPKSVRCISCCTRRRLSTFKLMVV